MTFKSLRKKAKLSVSESSKLLGIKEETLYKYETAIRKPSAVILINMVKVYKCTYDDVMKAYKENLKEGVSKYGKHNP